MADFDLPDIDSDHQITGANCYTSPHYDDRPNHEQPSLLVIHNISLPPGEYGNSYIHDLFMGTLDCSAHPYFEQLVGLRVSAHCVIDRQGQLAQYVPFDKRAWHAGVSSYQGRNRCNDFAIGIELEGTDNGGFTSSQYQRLIAVTKAIMKRYPTISLGRIVGHNDIAPNRKTDPGPSFDWGYYRSQLAL
ncbi:1,6-anhydro-N-acetylmuramyl-L-alanine amidase AmpD [Neiella marina]|uniref:1,6-anhydro-N-acetylmuramyl-L-alanine amidase AmpD n=1 Tax=Neiella holothuriorum TaxID=2870530 RepID=A0ABS7EBH2_9GAMM|nr:1,6-anhydro-N-acetylmuramyl-L-alanine amidase AmpD [Neiella holothuriorum]MBW8189554.1 1,6-anhydro-N-acetylmuramyl-L-alanine amidase AmpD [Neiella holothuriorum]